MASATGIPERERTDEPSVTEPLLGRPGDAAQGDGHPYLHNLTIGDYFASSAANLPGFMAN